MVKNVRYTERKITQADNKCMLSTRVIKCEGHGTPLQILQRQVLVGQVQSVGISALECGKTGERLVWSFRRRELVKTKRLKNLRLSLVKHLQERSEGWPFHS